MAFAAKVAMFRCKSALNLLERYWRKTEKMFFASALCSGYQQQIIEERSSFPRGRES